VKFAKTINVWLLLGVNQCCPLHSSPYSESHRPPSHYKFVLFGRIACSWDRIADCLAGKCFPRFLLLYTAASSGVLSISLDRQQIKLMVKSKRFFNYICWKLAKNSKYLKLFNFHFKCNKIIHPKLVIWSVRATNESRRLPMKGTDAYLTPDS